MAKDTITLSDAIEQLCLSQLRIEILLEMRDLQPLKDELAAFSARGTA